MKRKATRLDNLILMDREHLLRWQRRAYPGIEQKRRDRAARAVRQRWSVYRARQARRQASMECA